MSKLFLVPLAALSLSASTFAGTTADDFQTSKRFIQSLRGQSLDAMKKFNPAMHFKGYTQTPDEQRHYQGADVEKVDLKPAALEALKHDAGGQTVYENVGKTPQVVINQDSEAVRVARQIEAGSVATTVGVFCADGGCVQTQATQNTNAGQTLSALASVGEAGREYSATDASLFGGHAQSCNIHSIGLLDCCSDKGWGQKINVAHCQEEDKALGRAKLSFLVHYIGKYCAKKWPWPLKGCEKWKHSYCVFDTKMARIIQEGRLKQLNGNAMGSPEHPSCAGFSVTEFQRLNMGTIDFVNPVYPYVDGKPTPEAGIAGDIHPNTPNAGATTDYIQQHMQPKAGA